MYENFSDAGPRHGENGASVKRPRELTFGEHL
jgi:hypothetical protein